MNGLVVSDATVKGPKHLSIVPEKALPDLINHELPMSPTFQTNLRQALTWVDGSICWSVHQLNCPWQSNLLNLVLKATIMRAFLD